MFPMVFAFIFLVSQGISHLMALQKYRGLSKAALILCILINFPVLAINSVIPSRDSVCYFRFLHTYSRTQKMELLCVEKSIYESVGLEINFYKSKNVHCVVVRDTIELVDYLNKQQSDVLYILERDPTENIGYPGYTKENIYSLFPPWLLRNNTNHWQDRTRIWKIMKIRRIK